MKTKYSTLSRSRTYIVVPRDVPPENFVSVPETQKERRTGVGRCVLIPGLVLLVIAGLLAGLSWIIYDGIRTDGGEHSYSNTKDGDDSHGYQYDSPCSISPCQGGGSCEPHDGTFSCYCVHGRWGQFCEKEDRMRVARIGGQDYVRLRSVPTGGPRTSVRIKIRPAKTDGVILYSFLDYKGNMSLALVQGHVQFRYHLGDDHLVLQSQYQVSPATWHSLVIQTYHGDAMLKLDDHDPVLGSLHESKFAGLGPEVVVGGAGQVAGFTGCLKDLKLGHQSVSLVSQGEPLLLEQKGVRDCRKKKG